MTYIKGRALLMIVILMNLLVTVSHGQNSGKQNITIHGLVRDSVSGQPLEYVTVLLVTENESSPTGSVTTGDGSFTFNTVARPKYVLRISHATYKVVNLELKQSPQNNVIEAGIILLKEDSNLLGEVIITSTKPSITSEGEKLIYNASADISNSAGSAADVLLKTPLVTVDATGQVKVRGNSNIRVLLNGLPSGILARNLTDALKMIPANTIESIEVITSPSAKYEAEGAAGIINIVTKQLKSTSANINVTGGNLEQSANGNLNISRGKFTHSLTIDFNKQKLKNSSELNRNSFSEGNPAGSLYQDNSSITRSGGGWGTLSTEYRPDSLQTISASISYWSGSWPVRSQLYNLYTSDYGNREYNQKSNQSGKFGWLDMALNYQKKFSRKGQELKVLTQASKSKGNMSYTTDQTNLSGYHYFHEQSPNISNDWFYNFQIDYAHPLNKSGTNLFETGIRYNRTSSNSAYAVFNNLNSPGSEQFNLVPARSDTMDYHQDIYAGYVVLTIQLPGKWQARPGIRYERTSLGGEFKGPQPSFNALFGNVVPSVLLSKQVNAHHDIKFNYTERIRRPWIWDLNPYVDASDPLNLTFGNPQLRPEVTRTLEAGHGFQSDGGFSLNSSIYFGFNRNAIESLTTVDSIGVSRTTSRNIATNQRVEGNVNSFLPLNKQWNLSGGIEFYRVWFTSGALGVSNNGNFYSANLNSSYSLPKDYTIQISGNYDNGYVTLQGRSGANYTYRLTARKEFMKKMASVTIGLNNIFQKGLRQHAYASSSTFNSDTHSVFYNRSFTISLSWRIGNLSSSQGDYNAQGGGGGFPPR